MMVVESNGKEKSLLLVDDEPANLQVLAGYLDGRGLDLVMALNGESAIEKARKVHPDLILLDVMMPRMNGYEVCRALKSDASTRDIPVVFLSALQDTQDRVRGFESGGADFVSKPFQEKELLARIAAQLALAELQDDLRVRNTELEETNRVLRESLTRYEAAKSALGESEKRNRLLLDSTQEGIVGVDITGQCTFCNQAAATMLGFDDPGELVGRDLLPISHDCLPGGEHPPNEECPLVASYRDGRQTHSTAEHFKRADGTCIPVELLCSPMSAEGELVGAVISFLDITERKQSEDRLKYTAHHDLLTGLPNRLLLRDRLGQAVESSRRHDRRFAVLFVDLDHFKQVNDSFGHQIGDQLLRDVAARLRPLLRASDTVARVGGDEFVVVLEELDDPRDAARVARKLIAGVSGEVKIDGKSLRVGASIGIALYPQDATEPDALLQAADAAMYAAKQEERQGFRFYSPALGEEMRSLAEAALQLDQALRDETLELRYRPCYLLDGTLAGAEALPFWGASMSGGCATRGPIAPEVDDDDLAKRLGLWVLEHACRRTREWLDQGLEPPRVSVRLGRAQLRDRGLGEQVQRILDTTGIEGRHLEIEVTAAVILGRPTATFPNLQALDRMGISVVLDGFSAGFESMLELVSVPVGRLKLGPDLVCDLPEGLTLEVLGEAMLSIARSLQPEAGGDAPESPAAMPSADSIPAVDPLTEDELRSLLEKR